MTALEQLKAALVLLRRGEPAEAERLCRAALAADPEQSGAWHLLGILLLLRDAPAEAEPALARASRAEPANPVAQFNHGNALSALGRYDDAVARYRAAIALRPDHAEAHDNLGSALRASGRHAEAVASHARAIALSPDSAAAHNGRGLALTGLNRPEEAAVDFARAVELDPSLAWACNNLGNALHDLGRPAEALQHLERALALEPGYAEAHVNRGLVLQELRRFDEARAAYDAALAARPGYGEALKRRASLRLLQGEFRDGWADYDASARALRGLDRGRHHDIPDWTGQSLRGRSIVLREGSGLGDTIQFFRYAPAFVAMGARVAFLASPRLFRLLRSGAPQVEFVDTLQGRRFDYQCDLWSLPSLFGTTLESVPATVPYLAAEPEAIAKWKAWLGSGHFNIGIAWQGNPDRKIDHGRSLPLAALQPLVEVPGVRLVSLQRDAGLEQLRTLPAEMPVLDPGVGFDAGDDAFHDAAALMMGLDLVVSSDTAIAHLAGALARPTWVALKYMPEWRWMLDRADSPWYPTMRLFRQPAPGDWATVFDAMAVALPAARRRT